ncbi:MAG TPA: S-layer homology domain-containing protein [Vicinamibacterales bacterium]|nr:S-layer homology domain-containing protein [Vicinamibacterales bacterium]
MMRRHLAVTGLCLIAWACASAPPRTGSGVAFPDLPAPDIPARLSIAAPLRERHLQAWKQLQANDLRAATATYAEVLKGQPSFYPAETGLGLVAIAQRQYRPAIARFTAALARDARYLPALRGLVAAEVAVEDFDAAVSALERVIAIDPSREAERTRLELLRVRQVQLLTESGRRARSAGRHGEAADVFTRALAISPASATLMRELALEELAAGKAAEAEARVRKALQLESSDAETHAALGAILEARGRLAEAAGAYGRAAAIDSKWKSKAESARDRSEKSGLPDELRDLGTAQTVTRGDLAGLIGIRLATVLDRAAKRAPVVATDIRTHWAAVWIAAVTQAGVMDVYTNHTFQPAAVVRRSDLAQVASRLIPPALTSKPAELTKWQAARPQLADLPATNAGYRSAALAVTAGVLTLDDAGRFQGARAASGAEVVAAVARIRQLGER